MSVRLYVIRFVPSVLHYLTYLFSICLYLKTAQEFVLETQQKQLDDANRKLRSLNEARLLVTSSEVSYARASAKLDAVRDNVRFCRERLDVALAEEARLEEETRKLHSIAERIRTSWVDELRTADGDATESPTSTEYGNDFHAGDSACARSPLGSTSQECTSDVAMGTLDSSIQFVSVLRGSPFTPSPLEQYISPLTAIPL
jgi:hypothetical protein